MAAGKLKRITESRRQTAVACRFIFAESNLSIASNSMATGPPHAEKITLALVARFPPLTRDSHDF